ncbi:MAG: hypothetical protein H6993_01550 [Pseudomonadales bacterium]|nr:hypothetical protein [Pseudomonadales bacterium]MCP5182611.1 hypothetical protein [Pseudomonadales bacterium]
MWSRYVALMVVASVISGPALARETEYFFDVQSAVTSPRAAKVLHDIPFFMKGQEGAPVATRVINITTFERPVQGIFRGDKKTCDYAFLSSLAALQESAKADGGDTILNIVSSTRGKTTESPTQYRCIAGATIAYVALTGEVVTTQ